MRKVRPATLTPELLARKGEAEPARLNDGTVPKDVIALQEELVARVAAGISRGAAQAPGAPVLPQSVAAQSSVTGGLGDEAPQPAASAPQTPEPEAPEPEAPAAEADKDDDALGCAPIELPPGSADEPDYDPAEDQAAAQDSQVTLADWTARAQSGDTPFAYERMSDPEEPERSAFIPLALGVTVVAVLATLAIWQVSDHGQVFPQGPQETAAAPAPAAPEPAPALARETPPAQTAARPPELKPVPKPAAETKAPAETPAVPAMTGGYALQLVSTTSQATAEHAWDAVAAKIAAAGLKQPHTIEKADLGAKGVRYRVKLTGFASYAAGQKACETLKAHKVSCLVLKQ